MKDKSLDGTGRYVRRPLAVWSLFVVVALGGLSAVPVDALAEGSQLSSGSLSLLGGPLVVTGVATDEGQSVAVRAAELASPEAVREREASESAYEGFSPQEAQSLLGRVFPYLVQEPQDGPPKLPEGEQISEFVGPNAARVSRAGPVTGGALLLESLGPIAVRSSDGRWEGLDLSPVEAGSAYGPRRSDVAVRLPKDLSEGVSLPGVGVSLTPLEGSGDHAASAAAANGDGYAVFWGGASMGQDTDVIGRFGSMGVDLEAVLRSVRSPEALRFAVGMPTGAELVREAGSDAVRVLDDGQTLATIAAPSAHDAQGTLVPVSMSVVGSVLTVTVQHLTGRYAYPLIVDPTISDNQFSTGYYYETLYHSPWYFAHVGSQFTAPERPENGLWEEKVAATSSREGWGGLFYTTTGESQIIRAGVEGRWNDTGADVQNFMVLSVPAGLESHSNLAVDSEERYPGTESGGTVCAPELGCSETTVDGAAPANNNTAGYQQYPPTTGVSASSGWNTLKNGYVEIKQERSPELNFNTHSEYIKAANGENVPNVLYGNGGWLSPHSGAFEVHWKDFGIGISFYRLLTFGWGDEHPYYAFGECIGVQCPTEDNQAYGYNSKMADGEDNFEAFVEDKAGLWAQIYPQKIKVDGTAPHNIELEGLINGDELSAGETHLKVKATDGSGSTPSSGMRSITVSMDGQDIPQVSGQGLTSCPSGPCTTSGEWQLAGRNYATGQHALVVTATDNAGNERKEEFTVLVHPASPIGVGPGSVNPEAGDLSLGATDVSMGGGLDVGRSYDSRNLTVGIGGPFGPQWAANVGGMDTLQELPDGSVVLSGASQGAIFTRNEHGEFASPPGDGNLKIEAKESEKRVTAYLLKDSKAGTTTKFTLPEGSHPVPSWGSAFGSLGTGPGQVKTVNGMATDTNGDLWVADSENSRLEEFGPKGKYIRSIGSSGSGEGQFGYVWGAAVNQTNGNIYATDQSHSRVEEFSSEGRFIRSFGKYGTGAGEFGTLAGLTVDSQGDVWVCDYSNNRVEKFNPEGAYLLTVGSEGTGNGQLKHPQDVTTTASGNVYVTDSGNNRVEVFSVAGAYVRQIGSSGTGNGQFNSPDGIASDPVNGNVYVVDAGNNRVQEFSGTGTYLSKFGATGSTEGDFKTPRGIAISQFGELFVADSENYRVQDWNVPYGSGPWVPSLSEGPVSTGTQTYAFQAVEVEGKQVTEPILEVAPHPNATCEYKKLEKGCRALEFNYAESTTATGEAPSEWGDYKGRMTRVYFIAWEPQGNEPKAMKTVEVAHYLYDKQGRLRTEWDPRVKPELKTDYGYGAEGVVTAIAPPDRQPWLLHYGAMKGDTGNGRLLSVTRPSAATALGASGAPTNSVKPSVSSSKPVAGTSVSATSGSWSNSPLQYAYQWETCSSLGTECSAMSGATNSTYTPVAADGGHALVVQVTATNAEGSTVAVSEPTGTVGFPAPAYSTKFGSYGSGNGQFNRPVSTALDASGNVWVTDTANSRLEKFSATGSFIAAYGVPYWAWGIAVNQQTGNVYASEHDGGRIREISSSGTFIREFGTVGSGNGQLNAPEGVAVDTNGNVWVADTGNNRLEEFSETGAFIRIAGSAGTGAGQFKSVTDISFSGSNVYATDCSNNHVEEFSSTGSYVAQFGSSGSGSGQFSCPYGIAGDPVTGDMYIVDQGNWRVQELTPSGVFLDTFGSKGTGNGQFIAASGIAASSSGKVYIADTETNTVDEWTGNVLQEEPVQPPPTAEKSSVWTIDYNVPLSGSGLQNLTKTEVEKGWGQKDIPVEATAVFPPDSPQGWPASSYTRATIHYIDADGRAVNTATPGGGVATSEYNENNDVTRSLSADNRATALKAGSKSIEVAEHLDTESKYSEEGSELLETRGPEHEVKLANGEVKQARNDIHYYYDEGSPKGGAYGLLTKTTDGALLANGTEADVRTTVTSYSGQNNLGWLLRKPTSVTTDPNGLKLTSTTIYDSTTGNVLETRSPAAGVAEEAHPSGYISQWGSYGFGGLAVETPRGVAVDSKGNVWTADTGHNRIEEFSPTGEYLSQFGSEGSGNGQFKSPYSLAFDSKGNLWVADMGNSRVQEFSATGAYLSQVKASYPIGVAVDSSEHLWVTELLYERVQELTTTGEILRTFGASGSGNGQFKEASGIVIDKEGHVWVADAGNNRIQKFSSTGEYSAQYTVEKPRGLTLDTSGNLWVTRPSSVQEMSQAGTVLRTVGSEGSGNGQFKSPEAIALDTSGHVWVADTKNNRVQELSIEGAYIRQYPASVPTMQFAHPKAVATDTTGNVWVADAENHRIQEVSTKGSFVLQFSGSLAKPEGVALDSASNVWVTDAVTNKVSEYTSTGTLIRSFGSTGTGKAQFKEPAGISVAGEDVYVVDRGNSRIQQFNSKGEWIREFGKAGTGNGEFTKPQGIAVDPSGNVWVADTGNNRVQQFTAEGKFTAAYGTLGSGNGQFSKPEGLAFDTEGNLWIADTANNRIQELSSEGVYIQKFGTAGSGTEQFKEPADLAVDTSGHVYALDTGNARVQKWISPSLLHESVGTGGVHGAQTIYYTSEPNTSHPTCGEHIEWAGLVCQTTRAAQPEGNLPRLPVTTTTYNLYNQPLTITEAFGGCVKVTPGTGKYTNSTCTTTGSGEYEVITRTRTLTYNEAGRATSSEETSNTSNKGLPKVTITEEYGNVCEQTTPVRCVKQSTTENGVTQTITSIENTLGQLVLYTDADGVTTKYEYENGGDGRIVHTDDGKGTQAYTYNTTTGLLSKLVDTQGTNELTFTAAYNVEGRMTQETYPNGMSASSTISPTGEATSITYTKTSNCTEKCVWFSETALAGIHGETLTSESTLAKNADSYDSIGRLTEAQETPAGKDCTTRLYAYDIESDRTSQTTRESSTAVCATEGGTTQAHTYDQAGRLTDEGVTYDAFADTTVLPAADAGGHELQSTYYVDGQVETQTQNGQINKYYLDPVGRVRQTNIEGSANASVLNHYAGPGEALSWKDEGEGHYTRLVPGIGGSMSATEHNGQEAILQLHDLKGNIIATASLSETATEPTSTYNSSEFGVPTSSSPPQYSWLGTTGISSGLPTTGIITTGQGSYVPEIGKALQTEAVVPLVFPDGLVPASISQAPYLVADSEALKSLAVQNLEEQTAEQQEAEEKACVVASECVNPEEETVDPSAMLSLRMSKLVINFLNYGNEALGNFLSEKLGDFGEILPILMELFREDAKILAKDLEVCVGAISATDALTQKYARCRAYINLWGIVPTSWGVETCWPKYYKKGGKITKVTWPWCTKA